MYLSAMEIQGFKTFAQKTTLVFPAPKTGDHAVTVVVGPNGSGKSNIADAIRWCLGEQSMKLLRGKSSQDVIFSGSEGRGRSGFAEVNLTFDNSDKSLNVSFAEVVVTRRLYRDGESEYLLNGQTVRLSDIQLLLAEAGVGQRSYSVIGQGMIDQVLSATPEERKIFFDDATGVRGLQIKRHQALLKLQKSAENLADVEMVLRELEPRLSLLRKQVRKLNERETVAGELKTLSANYYGTLWWNGIDEKHAIEVRRKVSGERVFEKRKELEGKDAELIALEKNLDPLLLPLAKGEGQMGTSMQGLQFEYKKAQQDLADARRAHFTLERELELAKVKSQSTWAPLPLPDIIAEVRDVSVVHESLLSRLRSVSTLADLEPIIADLDGISARSKKLRDRLTRPNPEDFVQSVESISLIANALVAVKAAEDAVKRSELVMDAKAKASVTATSVVFTVQKDVRRLQQELSELEAQANAVAIDLARIETRLEGLKKEIEDWNPEAIMNTSPINRIVDIGPTHDRILRLRHQLELIGGIDESVMKEFAEAEERSTFLTTQVTDLRLAIASTEKVIDELDEQIRAQSDVAFKNIATEFQKYFAILFGGGRCSLVKLTKEELEDESDGAGFGHPREGGDPDVDTLESIAKRVQERKDSVVGIDIQATPPGKRLKSLNLLSGGERALTSIALVSAIMATNPAPFVVLDEVDAALDEANTVRFANIINELRKLTQFIVITHNRATMEKADVLYGVTMGDDGVSKLLSVKLEDYVSEETARR